MDERALRFAAYFSELYVRLKEAVRLAENGYDDYSSPPEVYVCHAIVREGLIGLEFWELEQKGSIVTGERRLWAEGEGWW